LRDIYREKKYLGMKKIIRLTESDLHDIIKESVKKILKDSPPGSLFLMDIRNVEIRDSITINQKAPLANMRAGLFHI
jgi:hypothetical protein